MLIKRQVKTDLIVQKVAQFIIAAGSAKPYFEPKETPRKS